MTVYCDACEKEYEEGVSKCCGLDVWVELRDHGTTYFCQECGHVCEVVDEKDYEKIKQEEEDEGD